MLNEIQGFSNYSIDNSGQVWSNRLNKPLKKSSKNVYELWEKGKRTFVKIKDILTKDFVKDIPGYSYKISIDGKIVTNTFKPIKTWLRTGYPQVSLNVGKGLNKKFAQHVLYYKNFVYDYSNYHGMTIDHIDGNKSNNSVENLKCVTMQNNIIGYHYRQMVKNYPDKSKDFNEKFAKRIPDFPNYSVTFDGRVYSHKSSKFLKISIQNKKYPYVSLGNNSKTRRVQYVKNLVNDAFGFGHKPNDAFINFIDDNPLNCHADNLQVMSRDNKKLWESYTN